MLLFLLYIFIYMINFTLWGQMEMQGHLQFDHAVHCTKKCKFTFYLHFFALATTSYDDTEYMWKLSTVNLIGKIKTSICRSK